MQRLFTRFGSRRGRSGAFGWSFALCNDGVVSSIRGEWTPGHGDKRQACFIEHMATHPTAGEIAELAAGV